jgi:hypothetical protein
MFVKGKVSSIIDESIKQTFKRLHSLVLFGWVLINNSRIVDIALSHTDDKGIPIGDNGYCGLDKSKVTKWTLKKDLSPNTLFTNLTDNGYTMALLITNVNSIVYVRPMKFTS